MHRVVVPLGVVVALTFIAVPPARAQARDRSGEPATPYRRPSVILANKLARRVNFGGFDTSPMTLGEALDFLSVRYGLAFVVDDWGFREAGYSGPDVRDVRVALSPIPAMQDVPLSAVLRAVIARIPSPSGATFVYRQDFIEITTRLEAATEGWLGMGVLVEDYASRVRYQGLTDVQLYTEDLARLVAELSYWKGVMAENARLAAAEVLAQPPRTPIRP